MRANNDVTVPWSRPVIWGNEVQYGSDAIASTDWSGGRYLTGVERRFGDLHEAPDRCLAISNGTTSIHLCLMALRIKEGDEVILPGYGFSAAANMTRLVGATPVFVDVDPDTWLARTDEILKKITSRTRLIILVHTYGPVCDVHDLRDALEGSGIKILEDCAESPFSKVNGDTCGTIGELASWSLQSTKSISCGEGGFIIGKDSSLLSLMRLIRSHGMLPERKYIHIEIGHNFRLTNIQAAVAFAQLEQVDRIIASRRRIYERYKDALAGLPFKMQAIPSNNDAVMWAIGLIPKARDLLGKRTEIMALMYSNGIECRPGFGSASEQPHFEAKNIPVSDHLGAELFSIPFPSDLSDEEMDAVVNALEKSSKC